MLGRQVAPPGGQYKLSESLVYFLFDPDTVFLSDYFRGGSTLLCFVLNAFVSHIVKTVVDKLNCRGEK